MVLVVGVHQAKTRLSALIRQVEEGEDVVIARGGRPVVRLVAVDGARRREFGRDRGLFDVPEDFDAPLPTEVLTTFES